MCWGVQSKQYLTIAPGRQYYRIGESDCDDDGAFAGSEALELLSIVGGLANATQLARNFSEVVFCVVSIYFSTSMIYAVRMYGIVLLLVNPASIIGLTLAVCLLSVCALWYDVSLIIVVRLRTWVAVCF